MKNTVERERSGSGKVAKRERSGERGLQKEALAVSENFDRSRSAHPHHMVLSRIVSSEISRLKFLEIYSNLSGNFPPEIYVFTLQSVMLKLSTNTLILHSFIETAITNIT